MRKTEFLSQLRSAVTASAEAALAGSGRSTRDCPYLESTFTYYAAQSSQHIERAVRRYAPESQSVSSAQAYVGPIASRVGRSVRTWARTGEITDIPEDLPTNLPGASLLGRVGAVLGPVWDRLCRREHRAGSDQYLPQGARQHPA